MAQIYVKYNPYKLETLIKVNGKNIEQDNTLYKIVKGKRLQEWVGKFPKMLVDELNTVDFTIEFYGSDLDWDDFEDSFNNAKDEGIIKELDLKFIEGKSDEDINDRIVNVFTDLREGPIDDFRDPKLIKAFNNINNSIFPINVIATMSSGKSTLINSLLSKKLMPSKNEACTATITEILDTDRDKFEAIVLDENDDILQEIPELTYEVMNELNDDENVYRIQVEGNIPFLDCRTNALMLVDTPGPNNAQNQEHKNTTYRAINSDSNNLILYVLNGTQLSTNDDASLLNYVAEQIKKGGKQVRDRFLFVINKMDSFNPEEENIEEVVQSAKNYLAGYGIDDPQIFPCSAYTALNIRTYLKDVDIEKLTWKEGKKLPSAARDTLPMIDKFNEYESMHLEKYSTLSPSEQRKINFRLVEAEKNNDTKEQALIHCGIYSIEAAITAYVKKYAKTKKIKDLVETFQEVLESNQILTKAKTKVATDEEVAKLCAERAASIRAMIDDGEEVEIFKNRINSLNPLRKIKKKASRLLDKVEAKTVKFFKPYGLQIENREEAKRLVMQFTVLSSDSIAEMSSELESIINHEIVENAENILIEYQEKLSKIDETSSEKKLDFNTFDLIKGRITSMRENIETWCSDSFVTEIVENYGDTKYEDKIYYEKVGQEQEKIIVGHHEEKVGTKRVKTGSHTEWVGTRKVKNPKKKGFFGKLKFWQPNEIEEDIYEEVDDYKDEDIYETVTDYKTIMKDIFKERAEHIEKFTVKVADLQSGLLSKLRVNINEGIKDAEKYAEEQIENIKMQFTKIFEELDVLIRKKYEELEECSKDQETKEIELEKNKKLLNWIEICESEINDIIDM